METGAGCVRKPLHGAGRTVKSSAGMAWWRTSTTASEPKTRSARRKSVSKSYLKRMLPADDHGFRCSFNFRVVETARSAPTKDHDRPSMSNSACYRESKESFQFVR